MLAKIDRDLPQWPVNGYIKYEVDGVFRIKFNMACTRLSSYIYKIAAIGHCGFPIIAKIDKVLPLWVINGRVKYEFDIRIWYAKHKLWRAAVGPKT